MQATEMKSTLSNGKETRARTVRNKKKNKRRLGYPGCGWIAGGLNPPKGSGSLTVGFLPLLQLQHPGPLKGGEAFRFPQRDPQRRR